MCELTARIKPDPDLIRTLPDWGVNDTTIRSLAPADTPPAFLSVALSCCHALPELRPCFGKISEFLSKYRAGEPYGEVLNTITRILHSISEDDWGQFLVLIQFPCVYTVHWPICICFTVCHEKICCTFYYMWDKVTFPCSLELSVTTVAHFLLGTAGDLVRGALRSARWQTFNKVHNHNHFGNAQSSVRA